MYAIEIENLTKIYPPKTQALKDINLKIPQGAFFGLLGANGAGKSTLIGILCSLVQKTQGHIKINGLDYDQYSNLAKSQIGLVPQEFNFAVYDTCLEILVYQAGYFGIARALAKKRAHTLLEAVGLLEKKNTSARNLSGGMKRRLMIARALMSEPQILILDEPTAGLDVELRRSIWDFLQKENARGRTIILTTHFLEEAEILCKEIAFINKGQLLLHDTTQNILKKVKRETVILYGENLHQVSTLEPYEFSPIDRDSIEVYLQENQTMSQLIGLLEKQGVSISRVQNKGSRLEDFLHYE